MSTHFVIFCWGTFSLYALVLLWQKTAVNLHAAHKKTDSRAAHKALLACFLLSCITWIITRVQRTENSSCVVHESWLACSPFYVIRVFCLSHDKNWRTHTCSPHASVNLDMSCTVVNINIEYSIKCLLWSSLLWAHMLPYKEVMEPYKCIPFIWC